MTINDVLSESLDAPMNKEAILKFGVSESFMPSKEGI
jgi:hypothetical protein